MVDPSRHYRLFQPDLFGRRRVDVIGAGALGSRTVLELAKLGVSNLHVWDFDKVEAHNVANQLYGRRHIGMPKVEAIQAIVADNVDADVKLSLHCEAATPESEFGEVVFVLVDSMRVRRALFEGSIRLRGTVQRLIEARMAAEQGRVYSVDPRVPSEIRGYERTLYTDEQATPQGCGTVDSVGSTAGVISNLAVFQFIRWWQFEQGTGKGDLEGEIIIGLQPTITITNRFL